MALPEYPFMDVKDYLALDEKAISVRYEYIDGRLLMLAGGSPDHSIIATNIASILHAALRKTPCTVYNSDIHFKLSESRYVHPDVTVGCDERDRSKKDNIQYPRLIIEVLSPGTENVDKGEKLEMYLDYPSIEEYILIASQKKIVEVYHRDEDTWVSRIYKPGSIIHLKSINVSVPFEDIYEKTSLA
ncbi:MAG: Uma2 family endonuclease [Ktedonobacteraceae bacterium]|nr:Uma2 family endonuclease [Ktedonobacteraceae bacterium]MBV9617457.1 Uma2 family endonuclease [Ktedonobacteraceae bacterium]MBV9710057.1 Uma2 family endonuclease [Ktedonobacteraceae bacterium]